MDQHVITTDPQALAAVPQMDQLAAQEAKAEEADIGFHQAVRESG